MKKVHIIAAAALALMVTACGNSRTAADSDTTNLQTAAAIADSAQDSTLQADTTAIAASEAEKETPELSVSSFYKKIGSGQYSFLSQKKIDQYLTDSGFTLKEKGTKKVTRGPFDEDVYRYPEWTYENGFMEVEIVTYPRGSEVYYIEFEFADKASADEFIKNAKADGFKKESYDSGLCKGKIVPLVLYQEGKEVKLSALRDED